jgi:5-methylcytosine-specific restriction enzyme subunit McrC
MAIIKSYKVWAVKEYDTLTLPSTDISDNLGEVLYKNYSNQLAIDPPSFKTGHQWKLTAKGWVGFIPCDDERIIKLEAKVVLSNLFLMLEYAYKLESFHILDNLIGCKSLEEFYEQLANILARQILDRGRKGFYRAYISQTEKTTFIKGRVNLRQNIGKPWDINLQCQYQEHSSDIEENQILSWTLSCIARNGICTDRVLPTVRRAYHAIRGLVEQIPFRAQDCINRLYNRLNKDYEPMHALCRFFLEHSGPSHEVGDHSMLPFLVDMERLYELFVAEWLKAHLPSRFKLETQDIVNVGETNKLTFKIDLVLHDLETENVICVLDTKYKSVEKPSNEDFSQVVTYASLKKCNKAFLIYPTPLPVPFNQSLETINIRSLCFSLSSDIEKAGEIFKETLLRSIGYELE